MDTQRPTFSELFVAGLMSIAQFYNFEDSTFWQKWSKISLTAILLPLLIDLLPGEPPVFWIILMAISFLAGVVGAILLLVFRISKEYEEAA